VLPKLRKMAYDKYLSYSVVKKHKRNKSENYIPLRDLLQKSHDDRVNEYLSKMDETTVEDAMTLRNYDATPAHKSANAASLTAKKVRRV